MKSARGTSQQWLLLILIFQIFFAAYLAASNTAYNWNYNITERNEDHQEENTEEYDNSIESAEFMNTNRTIKSEISYRLPNTTIPLQYFLHITTNIHRGILDYTGNCTIEILILENTSELVLNAHNLNIFQILIDDLTTQTSLKNISFKIRNQMLIIFSKENNNDDLILTTKSFMRNHRLRLEIHYSSVISAVSIGLYKMSYRTKDGATIIGASTQFEPIYARNALPCYDEPRFKSKFMLRVTHGSNYTAISNMPDDGKPIVSANNMTTTTFLETPKMSVYLLAFVISNFRNTSMQTKNLLQRVFLPPDADYLNTARFLENSIQALKAFEDLVDMPYLLPKLDHMILNETFGKGMENWGLITYSSKRLLNNSSMDTKDDYDLLEVQTHEIVHQWFGNLVTPEWWSYIWLSEGFATYYSQVLIDILRPNYKALQLYQLLICSNERIEAIYFESDIMTNYVETPLDIKNSFSRAAYIKAGCVIQMFEHAFGQQIFRRGISKYLKTQAYSTVKEQDFFAAIQAELEQHYNSLSQSWNISAHEIMHTWTHSKAFPVLRITRNYDNQSSIIHLQQVSADAASKELFWIPLNFVTAKNASFENTSADFFMPPVNKFSIDLETFGLSLAADDWLLANKKGTGFYGIVYDNTNMNLITTALRTNHSKIHTQNRISFFSDISNCKHQLKTTEYFIMRLESIKYLKQEEDPCVFIAAIPLMHALIDDFKSNDPAYQELREFLLQIVMPIYEPLSKMSKIERDVRNDPLFENIEELVCVGLEINECLLERKKFVLKFISNESDDENETVFELCSAAKVFTAHEFDLALDFFVGQNKVRMWTGLGCTRNETLYEKLLEKTFDKIEDEKRCEENLISYLDFLTLKRMSERKISWIILRKNILRIIETAPCVDMFFQKLSKNLKYIDESHKEELRFFYDLYIKRNGTAAAFDETIIGKKISKEFIEAKVITDVTKWLRRELKNSVDNLII